MPSKLREIASPETGLRKQLKAELRSNAARLRNSESDEKVNRRVRNDMLPELKLEHWQLSDLKCPDRLVRKCKKEHIEEIARSISFFGCCHPILINADGIIIDGASRYQAAQSLGLNSFPCIIVDHLTPSHRRALRLALNRPQEKGAWDLE